MKNLKKLIRISILPLVAVVYLGADLLSEDPKLIQNAKQITFVGAKSGEGYFSADGKKMVFQSEREPNNPFYQMFILDLESGNVQRLSSGQGKTTCGWIHPSMKKVMWSSTHLDKNIPAKVKEELAIRANPVKGRYSWSFDENFDIFESDLEGKHLKRLTKELGYDAEGSYSPDGNYIAFASNRIAYDHKLTPDEEKKFKQDPSYFMEIYIMKADGTDVKRLTNSTGYDGGPFFSADGKKITWRRFSESGASAEIYTMDVDGKNQKQITHLNSMSWAPFFHPSGDYIIFNTTVGGYSNFELFIVDSEGLKEPKRVTYAEGFDGLATFSPDAKKITWSHKNEKGESQIYIADWDDAKARKLLGLPEKVQSPNLADLKPEIRVEDAKSIVSYLASEEFKGRFTGSEEEKIYTQKISDLFKSWGLVPADGKNFIQTFEFVSGVTAGEKNKAEFKGRLDLNLKLGEDYQLISYSKAGAFNAAPVVFAGFGIKAPAHSEFSGFDSYKDLDVKGKWVVILDEAPKPSQKEFSKHTYLLSFSRMQHKITVAKNNGAFGVILVEETKDKTKINDLKFAGSLSDSQLPIVKITISVFEKLLKNSADIKDLTTYDQVKSKYDSYSSVPGFNLTSQYFSANIDLMTKKSIGRNVIARLDTKASKKAKAILIGAHGDHLGLGLAGSSLATGANKDKIHYGADDNASGVAGVLELAHFYSQPTQRKDLKRPIYFAVWSGEEIGVLGSHHFVNQYKKLSDVFVAGLNMDMIGRLRESLNIQGVGSAEGFRNIAEAAAIKIGVPLNLTSDPYLPTDSMSIYLAGVPSISFFTGAHSEYHTPLDKPETLNYEGLKNTINVVQYFADRLAKTDKDILKYEKVESNSGKHLEGRSFRIFLGTIPDYTQEGVKGVRITGVAKNSPAEKAGLASGDVITEFDKTKIENIYDYVYTLQSVKPDVKTQILVLRNGKIDSFDITPALKD
ncbi:biopolymer transporter Tol [Bdellovibrio sp. qaytius]|nr:biopolymer transporter Tol [Bdellovibrio sp. qaytius]